MLPWDVFWFGYASLIRWRTSRVAFFVMLGLMQYYRLTHGISKNPNPLDVFISAHFMHMVFPGVAGLIAGTAWGFMTERETQTLYKVVVYALIGGLAIFFANDIRYALWSSFL